MLTAVKTEYQEGFKMTFENGCTISVQFGNMNYCSRNTKDEAVSAEIAIFNKEGQWYKFGYDVVKGHLSANEVAEYIQKVSQFEGNEIQFINY